MTQAVPSIELATRVVMAMPIGPPYGGMTSNAAILRRSSIFVGGLATLVDTTPRGTTVFARSLHSARTLYRLISTVVAHDADAVFFSSSSFTGFYEKAVMGLACRALGKKTLIHLVGSFREFHTGSTAMGRRAIDQLVSSFDRVLVVSENVRAYLEKEIPTANVRVLPNPVECVDFPYHSPSEHSGCALQILFAGAIVEGKGVLDLIAAIGIARNELRDVRVVWIGDGPLVEECRRRIVNTGLEHLIEIRGFVDDAVKKQLFATSEILVLPSHFEALPVSVLEASSSGLAVIATDVGGVRSAVRDGSTGFVVPPRDPERLAAALIKLVRSPELRRSMGQQGAAWVRERFDAPIVASLLIENINAVARERTGDR